MNVRQLFKHMAAGVLAVASIAPAAAGTILYGTTNGSPGSPAISTLLSIDIGTGVTTVIGSVGYTVNGLTYDSSTGTLYGSARNDEGLLTIDTSTGAGSLVGAFNSAAGGCSSRNVLLASDSAGALFGWCDPGSDDLMTINKVTGQATIVGESGLGTGGHGMAFDNNDDLYLHQFDVYLMDTVTGLATFDSSTGASGHHGDFNPDDNLYYGMGDFGATGTINVFDLVAGTGLVSSITLDRSDVFALAFAADEVPAPAPLALLAIGLLGAGFAGKRRRSH